MESDENNDRVYKPINGVLETSNRVDLINTSPAEDSSNSTAAESKGNEDEDYDRSRLNGMIVSRSGLGPLELELFAAAAVNDTIGCKEAIRRGANPNAANTSHVTVSHIAAEMGFTGVLYALVNTARERGLVVNLEARNVFGNTPLIQAVRYDRIAVLQGLLDLGADPNTAHSFERTAMHVAAFLGRDTACRLLVEAKAQVNAVDCFDLTPLGLALIARSSVRVVRRLLKAGADPNFRSKSSLPLLSLAVLATTRHRELVNIKFLLRAGADIRATDRVKGDTALHKAAMTGFVPAISLLHDNGAELSRPNLFGETALNVAIRFGNSYAARYLLHLEDEEEEQELRQLGIFL